MGGYTKWKLILSFNWQMFRTNEQLGIINFEWTLGSQLARRQPSVELFDGGDFAKVLTGYWYGYSPDFYFLSESNHNVVKKH